MTAMLKPLKTWTKRTFRNFAARNFPGYVLGYRYMHTPQQMMTLGSVALEAARQDGAFLEIGCAYGETTVFLGKLLQDNGYTHPYHVIDTFEGFTERDIAVEVKERNVMPTVDFNHVFGDNDEEWFARKMRFNSLDIAVHKADCVEFDYTELGDLAFCLFDVDFYFPTKEVLPTLYEKLLPGGIIVIDDCDKDNPNWNGAYQAYEEFVTQYGLKTDIRDRKLGVIQK